MISSPIHSPPGLRLHRQHVGLCILFPFLFFFFLGDSVVKNTGHKIYRFKVRVQFHSCLCGYPAFQAPIVVKTVISPLEWSWHTCRKTIDHIWVGLFPSPLFFLSHRVICLSLCQHHTALITVSSEIRTCDSSNSVLLFQDSFGYFESLESPYNFRMAFSISAKKKTNVGGI